MTHRRAIFSIGPDMSVRRQWFHDLFTPNGNGVTLTWRGMRYPITPRQHRAVVEQFEAQLEVVTAKFQRFFVSTIVASIVAIPAWFGLQDWLLSFLPETLQRFVNGFVLLQPLIWAGGLAVTQELRISSMIERLVAEATDRIDCAPERVGPATNWGEEAVQVVALGVFSAILFGFLLR